MATVNTHFRRTYGIRNYKEIEKALVTTMQTEIQPYYVGLLNAIVSTWDSDVSFTGSVRNYTTNILLSIFVEGKDYKVWSYVDNGTKPHPITVTNAPFLVFPMGVYVPRTRPIAQTGGAGKHTSVTGTVFTKEVKRHPGNKAREFSKEIVSNKKHRDFARGEVAKTIRRVMS